MDVEDRQRYAPVRRSRGASGGLWLNTEEEGGVGGLVQFLGRSEKLWLILLGTPTALCLLVAGWCRNISFAPQKFLF
jgi:hypothetical protein